MYEINGFELRVKELIVSETIEIKDFEQVHGCLCLSTKSCKVTILTIEQ